MTQRRSEVLSKKRKFPRHPTPSGHDICIQGLLNLDSTLALSSQVHHFTFPLLTSSEASSSVALNPIRKPKAANLLLHVAVGKSNPRQCFESEEKKARRQIN